MLFRALKRQLFSLFSLLNMFNLIIDQQLILISKRTRFVQLTVKLILIEKIIIFTLFDSFDLAMILEEADSNEKMINIIKRLLMIIVFSKVIVNAIIMSDFR